MKLSRHEMKLLVGALYLAIESELELVAVYTNRHTGKSIDPEVTTAARRKVAQFQKLRKKIDAERKTKAN